jgi:hypothetical protein
MIVTFSVSYLPAGSMNASTHPAYLHFRILPDPVGGDFYHNAG